MPNRKRTKINAPIKLPSVHYLRECFDYNPETGELRWKRRPQRHFATVTAWGVLNSKCAGKVAGQISIGYRLVGINGRLYRAHRIIFKLMTSEEPPDTIDHKDLNRDNNRWANLRPATYAEEKYNLALRKDNTSGYKGVSRHKEKWRAYIFINGRQHNLGSYFKTAKAASAARNAAAKKLHGEFYRRS